MINKYTYDEIRSLLQSVEIVSDMVQCHFHCPIKSKKIVAITCLSKHPYKRAVKDKGIIKDMRCSLLFELKKYFFDYEKPIEVEDIEAYKQRAVIHAFAKISDRFIWSDHHKHYIYRY